MGDAVVHSESGDPRHRNRARGLAAQGRPAHLSSRRRIASLAALGVVLLAALLAGSAMATTAATQGPGGSRHARAARRAVRAHHASAHHARARHAAAHRAGAHHAAAGHAVRLAGPDVALGDSYASAPVIPQQTGKPAGCMRSDRNYPSDVAGAIRPPAFTDVTCSGATTADMTGPQHVTGGTNPAQLSAVTPRDSMVTLTIGGNDIGFASIIDTCATLSFSDPFGAPCKAHYTARGTDRLAQAVQRTAPKVDATLRAIRARAPRARVLLVGYPDILPDTGEGCWPAVPLAYGDVPYLRGVETKLNQMLAAAAASNGAAYVGTYADSIGHDVCKPPKTRWVEGATLTSPAAPFHPNSTGEQQMADQVLALLR